MSDTTKRWISGGFFSIFVLGIISIGLFGVQNPAYATDTEAIFAGGEAAAGAAEGSCLTAGATPAVCPATGIKESLNVVGGKIVSPAFRIALIQALLNLSQFVLNRLAYEAAVAIASGGPGEESLFYQQEPAEAFAQLGLEVAGEAVGMLSELTTEELGIEFNLCAPSSDLLNLALAIGIKQKYQPTAPKCDILEVGKNWSGMFANLKQTLTDPDAINDAILSKFAESLKPGKNELSATLRINIAIDQKIHEQQLLQFLQQNEREYRPVTDFITGNVKTPSETLQGDFESKLKEVNGDQSKIQVGELVNAGELIGGLALSTASTFTNTLLSQLMGRIYTGLFETDPLPDPFDLEAVGGGDKSSAQERFASIIATNPIATAEYNALSEFVVCTAEGVTNRGLNNCVMDVNFLAAVSRGNAGTAITVQEAIDEGLLNGDWPLISPENEPANQDPYCYTYGYCYGNVVKLRKARVLPIGWELAALRNSEGNPATLQEVIDGFNDCTEDGTIGPSGASDSSAKWCHLIDPNWVLKYPDSQCRAIANGEVRLSTLSPGRISTCVDAPSCIGEDNDGNCVDGYGYCVQEKNVWRFRGDECPEEYATCLSFQNTETGDAGDFLVNTVDYSVCDEDNAGCRWYRTSKYYEDGGTADDTSDDSYEWLPEGDTYTTADRDDDWNYQDGGASASRETYSYTSDSGETYSYTSYAYEDRLYLTHNATECSDDSVGCTQLYEFDTDVYLNGVQNPSFEDDEDSDGVPDGWIELTGSTYYELDTSDAQYGSTSARVSPSLFSLYQQDVNVVGNNFYTFSAYFKAETSGDSGVALLVFLDEDGNELDASGTSSSGDCSWDSANLWYSMVEEPSTTAFDRFECLVTTPTDTAQIRLYVGNSSLHSSDDVYVDAVQLELGEDANTFAEGYSTTPVAVYYQIAPDYLGCTGGANDPAECDGYAQVCSAQDVGCNLYAPEDGDPSVPAIISELDQCPSECVGYTTYKQEATDYESEDFPLYFIATSASSCSEQYVGCDSYTNLASVEAGGEGTEYYTNLRSCLTEAIADGDSGQVPSTYFTWEGSDNEGYQLQTWYLLESNYSGTKDTFDGSGFEETSPELAPCTNIVMNSPDEVLCRDSNAEVQTNVWGNEACDQHDDIFDNPDCREFFDTEGNIHYRQYSDTISISDACTPYRKDSGEETDCEDSGGYWTEQGFCRYYVLPEESTDCPAEQNGCREYTGGAGRNASTILSDTFEGGTYEDFAIADIATSSASSISSYISRAPSSISVSNESVATEGHSLYVLAPSTGIAGIETVQISNTTTYDADTASTCSGTVSDAGCDLTTDNDGDGSDDESCTVSDGSDSCGTLAGSLVAGKTFVLDFWAKGNGNLYVTFEEEGGSGDAHDFVNPTAEVTTLSSLTPVALDGSWALYSLGPLDTSSYDAFDETAVLRFAVSAGGEFYIDNITLKQVEENLTLIKDSWVVPSTCDQTPGGVDSDQYYLGCEAYTDQNGSDVELYQFSDLCSEEVVGCEGFFDTGNSDSAYQEVFNARCVYSTDASYDLTDGEVVESNTACIVNDITYCTISTGRSYCTFDAETVFESPLPIDTSGTSDFAIVYGPETAVVAGDTPVYIVADDAFACTSSVMGCQEVGEPTYNQDQSEVESFESAYYINLPGDYDNILCEHEALFCEEWSSTQDGNFYFKDPLDKSCEYKSTVTIENQSYFGWFRTGTTEPCYWEDKNGDGEYTRADDEAYLVAGEEFSVWRNGDEDDTDDDLWDYYDGWVASCEGKYDLCTEFIDVVDTGGGLNDYGQSYYFTNDELLSEDNLTDNQRCNGQVSQKFGCALFNNTTNSELTYNTSASYVTAVHADVIYGTEENDLVDPISCTTEEGGVFTVSEASAELIGLSGQTLDVCARRCVYEVEDGDSITTDLAQQVGDVDTAFLERSCLFDTDCPTLTTYLGEDVSGSCGNTDQALADLGSSEEADDYYLVDDANEVLKVDRDRSCSGWLACKATTPTWNAVTYKYDAICEGLQYCIEGTNQGDASFCTDVDERDPIILSDFAYSSRDVTWTGIEYSGFSIPNQIPTEFYEQVNLFPDKYCVGTSGAPEDNDNGYYDYCATSEDCEVNSTECETDSDCSNSEACDEDSGFCFESCETADADYRLVFDAGPCDSSSTTSGGVGQGGSCTVGFCEDSQDSCSSDDDCSDEESCVIGYLQATADTGCANEDCSCNPDDNDSLTDENPDCSGSTGNGIATEICDPVQFICVDELATDETNRDACVTNSSTRDCVPVATSVQGMCFNDRCITDIRDTNGDKLPDLIDQDDVESPACRAYPEVDSPFPYEIVETWMTYADDNYDNSTGAEGGDGKSDSNSPSFETNETRLWSRPYNYASGFQDSKVCSPDEDGTLNNDCLCSYDKLEYGEGSWYRYVPANTSSSSEVAPEGVCNGGNFAGWPCDEDADCSVDDNQAGTCARLTADMTIYGWEGYCIERDTSIAINGDASQKACLSWLPIDRLTGSTDLYAKYSTAGYALQNTYYCAETAYYVDRYVTGARFNSDGEVTGVEYACAESVGNGEEPGRTWEDEEYESGGACDWTEYDSCWWNAFCPDGYFAIVGACDNSLPSDYVSESSDLGGEATSESDNDSACENNNFGSTDKRPSRTFQQGTTRDACPYICVPTDSYHINSGEACDPDDTGVYSRPSSMVSSRGIDSKSSFTSSDLTNESVFGTPVYLAGNLSAGPDSSDDFTYWMDCVDRGVPYSQNLTGLGFDVGWYADSQYNDSPANPAQNYYIGNTGYWYAYDQHYSIHDYNIFGYGAQAGSWGIGFRVAGAQIKVCEDQGTVCSESTAHCYGDCITATTTDSGNMRLYLACEEIVQTATDSVTSTDMFANKAWTQRTWSSSTYAIQNPGDFIDGSYPLTYSYSTTPTAFGRTLFDEYYSRVGGSSTYWIINEWGQTDGWPIPLKACDFSSVVGGTVGLAISSDSNPDCGSYTYPSTAQYLDMDGGTFLTGGNSPYNLGRSFEDIDRLDEYDLDGDGEYFEGVGTGYDSWGNSDAGGEDGASSDQVSVTQMISQLFVKVYKKWRFDFLETEDSETGYEFGQGAYELVSDDYSFDISSGTTSFGTSLDSYGSGDYAFNENEVAPVVLSIGDCVGTECQEGNENSFSVNGLDRGTIEGAGEKYIASTFFTYAQPNQLPIRRIIMDWGESKSFSLSTGLPDWPTDTQSGSDSHDNFYQNHRGLDSNWNEECDGTSKSTSSESCSTSYVTFTNNYTCTQSLLNDLVTAGRVCTTDDERGNLTNSPCTGGSGSDVSGADGACVFQPRVHVLDNWGWCTGFCDSNPEDDSDACYADECDFEHCPSGGYSGYACPDREIGGTSDPWVYFDGYIIVTPD